MWPSIGVGFCIHNEGVCNGAVGDPKLVAIEHVSTVALVSTQLHGDDIAPSAWLGHGKGTHVLASDELREVGLALLLAAIADELIDAQVAVGAVGQRNRARGPAQLLVE